ncbi:MAG: S9 family peptidase [Bacteroidales bacterium]
MKNLKKIWFVFLMLFISIEVSYSSGLHANEDEKGVTIEDVTKIKQVTGVTLSEDGNHIAYTVNAPADPVKKNESAEIHLYVYNSNTNEHVSYYTDGSVRDVKFRPNHNTITFITRKEGKKISSIYEMPINGGGATELYGFKTSVNSYEWASDGNKLIFTAREPAKEKRSKLPFQPEVYEEGLKDRKAYLINIEAKQPNPKPLKVEGTIYTTRWSPDDKKIAVAVAPTPLVDDYYMKQDVKVINAETREVIGNEIKHEGKLADIQWSPEGSELALLAGNDIHDVIAGRIMVVSAKGGTPKNIHPDFKGKFEQIDWTSPESINFIASESTVRGFGSISPDGSDFSYKIKPGSQILESFSFADDRHIAFLANTPKHPNEVYYMKEDNKPERVTNMNTWLDKKQMGEQEIISYEARDGKNIEGLLIKPVNYEEGKRVPLIVRVHGGPESHYSNGWLTAYSSPGQVGAAKGYAVFYPNYRGSTGRGIEYLKSSQEDAGGKEYDDIMDGVDYLIQEGIADPERVGVTGGSYGGYATGWMATYYSDRFAAGVMNFGISNKISSWGTGDIPMEEYLVHSREWFWEDNNWQKYLERSPIYHVDKAKTPLLITHGKADTRVDPGQSLEMYRHIKVRKPEVPLRLVEYPGAGHGYRRASVRYDYSLRMFRWFDTYLKGDKKLPERSINKELPSNDKE